MTAIEVLNEVEAAPRESWPAMDKLAGRLRAALGEAPDMLARFWNARIGAERAKYSRIMQGIDELGVPTWLTAADAAREEDRLAALRGAAAAAETWRRLLAARLSPMLERKTAIAPPVHDQTVEEQELPSRDCDEVYLALRRILRPDESEYVSIIVRRRFLRMPEQERDAEIESFRRGGAFAAIAEVQS